MMVCADWNVLIVTSWEISEPLLYPGVCHFRSRIKKAAGVYPAALL